MANKESSEAAKKIAKAEKEKASKKPNKNKKNVFQVIARFFKDLKGEVKKITWPGAKEVLKGTLITLACIAVIGAVVCLVDLGLTSAIDATREAAYNRTTETTAEITSAKPVVPSTAATTTTTAATSSTAASSTSAAK